MKTQWSLKVAGVVGAALGMSLVPQAQAARTAIPGTVNYIEGKVSIDGGQLNTQQAGDALLHTDQILSVDAGKAEVLLSPGVFMRVGSNSQVRMVSANLVDPRVEVLRGEAMVEVDQKLKQAHLDVLERGSDTALLKEGLYKFDADEAKVEVIDGKVSVNDNGQTKEIGKGKEVVLNGAPLKAESFDRKSEDELYRWSEVRSGYLAQASEATARTVYVNGMGGWGSGWYWNPYFSTFSWLPGDGYFFSPFGYPFYSPRYVVYAPGFSGRGFYPRGGGVVVPSGPAVRAAGPAIRSAAPSFRAAPSFHASAGMMGGRAMGRR